MSVSAANSVSTGAHHSVTLISIIMVNDHSHLSLGQGDTHPR